VETPLGGRRPGRAERPLEHPVALPDHHPPRGDQEDHPPAAALPPRTDEDPDAPAALRRRADRRVDDLPHPQTPRDEPAARLPTLQDDTRSDGAATTNSARATSCRSTSSSSSPPPQNRPAQTESPTSTPRSTTAPRLRILRIHPRSDQKTAIQILDYVLSRLPFRVEKIQTDNGAEFQSAFHWYVLDQGISRTYIRPATPPGRRLRQAQPTDPSSSSEVFPNWAQGSWRAVKTRAIIALQSRRIEHCPRITCLMRIARIA
jgi:hypothetical protein